MLIFDVKHLRERDVLLHLYGSVSVDESLQVKNENVRQFLDVLLMICPNFSTLYFIVIEPLLIKE